MMQDNDPQWSAVVMLDYFIEISSAARILTVCLEQIADNPPDLIPRLHWFISVLQSHLETLGEDGASQAKRVRDYLYKLEPGGDDENDRPGESPQ